jgi:uncharacterized protein YjcR
VSEKRDWGAYKKNAEAIEEMYMAGIPCRLIAETLGLHPTTLNSRVNDWGLSAERELYRADLAKEIVAKHTKQSD